MQNDELVTQILELKEKLKAQYLLIADAYKRISKVSDKHRLDTIQAGIDRDSAKAMEIRIKLEETTQAWLREWEESRGTRPNKSKYD